jgi:TIR domain
MLYFFSYARADGGRFLNRFYADLREEVRNIAGVADAESIAFRDVRTIEPGKPWPEQIEGALRSCKVFVYLHTPTFFGRDGCGKEFQAIKDRLGDQFSKISELGQAHASNLSIGMDPKKFGMFRPIYSAYKSRMVRTDKNTMTKECCISPARLMIPTLTGRPSIRSRGESKQQQKRHLCPN